MGKKIAMISALGGQGTTLAAACMGLSAAALGYKTTLVDLCGFGGTLAQVLSVGEEVVMNLADVLGGTCTVEDAFITCGEGLRFLPSPLFSEEAVDPRRVEVRRLVEELGREGDVIVDWPAGVVPDCGAAGCFDVFILCACADSLSLQYAAALRRRIRQAAADSHHDCETRLLLTQFSPAYLRDGGMTDIDACIDTVGARLLGVVPLDTAAGRAVRTGLPLDRDGEAMRYCRDAVRRLFGETVPLDAKTSLLNQLTR